MRGGLFCFGAKRRMSNATPLEWWRDVADPHRTAAALKHILTGSMQQSRSSSAGYKRPNKYSSMARCYSNWSLMTCCLRRLPLLPRFP
jgi:hypothetical protein